MAFSIPDTKQFPWDQPLARHLAQFNMGQTGGINTWTENPTVGVDGMALGADHVGYTGVNTTSGSMVRWDGTSWLSLMDGMKVARADISFYVHAASGLDTNSGISLSQPLKTSQKLREVMSFYNFLDVSVTIYLGPGEYNLNFINLDERDINIIGAGSSQTRLTKLDVSRQRVAIRNLTLHCITAGATVVSISPDAELHFGPDIVMGGTVNAGSYVHSNGRLHMYPNCPVKVTNNCGHIFNLQRTYGFLTFRNDSTIVSQYSAPPAAIPASTPADVSCSLEFIGNRTVSAVINAQQGAGFWGDSFKGTLNVTGAVTGMAYQLILNTKEVYISTIVGTAAPNSNTIGYPASISAGYTDSTSGFNGTRGI